MEKYLIPAWPQGKRLIAYCMFFNQDHNDGLSTEPSKWSTWARPDALRSASMHANPDNDVLYDWNADMKKVAGKLETLTSDKVR